MAILMVIPRDLGVMEMLFVDSKVAKKISDYFLDLATQKRILSLDCGDYRVEKSIDLGSGIRAIEQSYKLQNSGIFEAHREFVDFQFVAKGSEIMKVGDFSAFSAINDYESACDRQNFTPLKSPSQIALYENHLLILMPNDIHSGGFLLDSQVVFKSVLKVPTTLLKITQSKG